MPFRSRFPTVRERRQHAILVSERQLQKACQYSLYKDHYFSSPTQYYLRRNIMELVKLY